jgi:hypothetical protein
VKFRLRAWSRLSCCCLHLKSRPKMIEVLNVSLWSDPHQQHMYILDIWRIFIFHLFVDFLCSQPGLEEDTFMLCTYKSLFFRKVF